jgi:hypothetical protein
MRAAVVSKTDELHVSTFVERTPANAITACINNAVPRIITGAAKMQVLHHRWGEWSVTREKKDRKMIELET